MVETTNIFDLLGDNDEVDVQPKAAAPKAAPAKAKEADKPGESAARHLQRSELSSFISLSLMYDNIAYMVG